jgi:flavin reductase ActVB
MESIGEFKEALARFASGVTVVTTPGTGTSAPEGFTASAFSALSLDPPLVLVCLDKSASCHDAFKSASAMAISVLSEHQQDIAMRFASREEDKFDGGVVAAPSGLLVVSDAAATLECALVDVIPRGDHSILIGEVRATSWTDSRPLIYWNRAFGGIA